MKSETLPSELIRDGSVLFQSYASLGGVDAVMLDGMHRMWPCQVLFK